MWSSLYRTVLAALLGLALAACGGGGSGNGTSSFNPELAGNWGGPHIALTIANAGSTVNYDCAHGSIDGTLQLDQQGRFVASGIHVWEHGGPVRQGEPEDAHPAHYTGQLQQDALTLTVTLTDTGQSVGTFVLQRNGTAQVFKCL